MKLLLVLFPVLLHTTWAATAEENEEETEAKANRVEAAIYQLSKSKWDSEVGKEYINLVVEETNKRCALNPADCGLKYWNDTVGGSHEEFKAEDFKMANEFPSYKKPYLNISYALRFPDGVELVDNPETKYYLKKSALLDVSKDIQGKFTENTGYRVLKMDHVSFNMPPNKNLNIIMCVIAVLLFLFCIILLFVLRYSCSHAHKPEPVEKIKVEVEPPENEKKNQSSSKDNLQNTGV